ncbi:prepilin peptidase [Bacillus sp. AFS015802]|uniref:A24 family peptidase n=1 Tax=Bacillus sp. AFS015802 TaxID=2033486 RepID=UPI000BF9AEB5|nr:A24 family peptidase [Bacillus sp. AFS015802]PFA67269.1 prepilin peptidase [Bacillus sp. AFS015802]
MLSIYFVLIFALGVSLFTDLKKRKILNIITFPAILIGLLFYSITQGWDGFFFSSAGFLVGMGTLLIPFLLGGMGAGDVKLMGTVGALMGSVFTLKAFVVVALIGGFISLILIVKKNGIIHSVRAFYLFPVLLSGTKGMFQMKADSGSSIAFPYGVPIVIGTFITLLWGVV